MKFRISLKIFLPSLAMIAVAACSPVLMAQEIHLEDDLILYLPMNGNAMDESGENVPTKVEGPVVTADRYGNPIKAYLFNGFDDNINLNNNEPLITSKQFTICMWARIDGRSTALASQNNSLFEQRDHFKDSPVVIHFNADYNKVTRFVVRSSAENALYRVDTPYPGDGSWHFYTAMIDDEKNMHVFIDGQLRGSSKLLNDGNFTQGINRVNIGAHHPESIIYGAFNGAIDEVFIYNRALNLCEIEALYSGQLLDER